MILHFRPLPKHLDEEAIRRTCDKGCFCRMEVIKKPHLFGVVF